MNRAHGHRRYESGKLPVFLANSASWRSLPHDLRRTLFFAMRLPSYLQLLKLRNTASSNLLAASLKPFLDTGSIYIHIPKAAGTSITQSLYGRKAGDHRSIDDYKLCFSKGEFDRAFKFTIVRDPWDRALSAYNYLRQGGRNAEDKHWANTHLARYKNFPDFVLNWMTPASIRDSLHFRPQYEFLSSNGLDIEVDFVGYYETLAQDYQTIASKIGSTGALEKLNSSEKQPCYRSSYNAQTRQHITELYERDITLFGYSFEPSTRGNNTSASSSPTLPHTRST